MANMLTMPRPRLSPDVVAAMARQVVSPERCYRRAMHIAIAELGLPPVHVARYLTYWGKGSRGGTYIAPEIVR